MEEKMWRCRQMSIFDFPKDLLNAESFETPERHPLQHVFCNTTFISSRAIIKTKMEILVLSNWFITFGTKIHF